MQIAQNLQTKSTNDTRRTVLETFFVFCQYQCFILKYKL